MNIPAQFRLDERIALVTGAGRGLGRACAIGLAQAGAQVWLVARTAAEIEKAAAEIRAGGGRAHAAACDVTDAEAFAKIVAALPALDVFVNNAGTNVPEPFVEVSAAHLDRMLDLNVRAAFLAAQAAARKMLEHPQRASRGGAILHMSSQMGHVGGLDRSVYCMTKHALEGLTKAMAFELAPRGIRVVSIAPTFVETPMTKPMFEKPVFRKWVDEHLLRGRLGTLEEVAAAVVFAASPAGGLVTGSSLLLDGGWTAH